MSLLDRDTQTESAEAAPSRPWLPTALGAAASAGSLLLVVLPVLVAWAADATSPGSWQSATGLASAAWLATLGSSLSLQGAVVSFVPLVLMATPVLALAWSWWRVLRVHLDAPADDEGEEIVAGVLPRRVLVALAQWWTGHLVVLGLAIGAVFLGPARPHWPSLVLAALFAPIGGVVLATARMARSAPQILGHRLDGSALPPWLRGVVGPAVRGVAVLLVLGAALVLVAVALHWDRVVAVQAAVGGGTFAAIVLTVVQVASLPNLALWCVSFLAGPGFSVVNGAAVSWSGASTGLMPLVPVLAAYPQPGSFPWFTPAVVLVPLAVGWSIGTRALKSVARLSAVGTKVKVAATAATLTAALVSLLDLVGGGSLGAYRLSSIGAPAGWLFLALVLELVAGAVVAALWDAYRLRR